MGENKRVVRTMEVSLEEALLLNYVRKNREKIIKDIFNVELTIESVSTLTFVQCLIWSGDKASGMAIQDHLEYGLFEEDEAAVLLKAANERNVVIDGDKDIHTHSLLSTLVYASEKPTLIFDKDDVFGCAFDNIKDRPGWRVLRETPSIELLQQFIDGTERPKRLVLVHLNSRDDLMCLLYALNNGVNVTAAVVCPKEFWDEGYEETEHAYLTQHWFERLCADLDEQTRKMADETFQKAQFVTTTIRPFINKKGNTGLANVN